MIIYKTTNLINGRIYIGQDSNNNPGYLGSGKILKLALKKYGIENFKKEILESCTSKEELDEREKYWIEKFGTKKRKLYNITPGGSGGDTYTNNPNLEKIKKKFREKEPWNKGKKLKSLSKEHKKNQSKSLKEFYKKNDHHSKGKAPWNKGKKGVQVAWNKGSIK